MTNSEIKKLLIDIASIIKSNIGAEVNRQLSARDSEALRRIVNRATEDALVLMENRQHPTRTPEPTNDMVIVNGTDKTKYITSYKERIGVPENINLDPEPTKAENGLVRISWSEFRSSLENEITKHDLRKMSMQYEYFSAALDSVSSAMSKKFATPSITKEQLLAILPKKESDLVTPDGKYGYELCRETMKQRIEELYQPATLNDRGSK